MSTIVVIETPVTDYLYDEARANTALRDAFFHKLSPFAPPRKGDNLLVWSEIWMAKLEAFGIQKGLLDNQAEPIHVLAEQARDKIFGAPVSIQAGGALANSFDAIVKAELNGKPLVDGVFVTALGSGVSGEVFAQSLQGKIISPAPWGWQLEAHVLPLEGDRVLVSIPSLGEAPTERMSPDLLDKAGITEETKMVMLGGYMGPTGKYEAFLDRALEKIAQTNTDPKKRPTLVLTTAAQEIAASSTLREALARASLVTRVIVSANTGEFRRLLKVDTNWRLPFEKEWINGDEPLKGNDLERAKEANIAYQAAKLAANEAAYRLAYDLYCREEENPVTFVVTNGKKGVHVVSERGISGTYRVPSPPYGVVNTVGGGDGFWGGFALGSLIGLNERSAVQLGFVAAGAIIGQNEARLRPLQTTCKIDGKRHRFGNMLAYLDPENPAHRPLMRQIVALTCGFRAR